MSLSSKSKTIDKSLSTSIPSNSSSTSSNLYRNLIWSGSIPISITISPKDLPSNADLTIIDSYYLQLPRISYLPLYLNQIRKYFLDLVLDESSNAALNDDEIWFESNGIPLKWHWPIGLLYDYHTSHTSLSSSSSSTAPLSPVTSPKALTLPLFPSTTNYFSTSPTTLSSSTFASTSTSTSTSTFPSSNHNLNSSTGGNGRPTGNEGGAMEGPIPWKITMHLKDSPQDTLLLGPSVEGCKGCFMNMIKEADFVRWGSVKRVTNLRKEQQDSLWEGLVNNDFEKFWTVASKLIPLPNPPNNNNNSQSFRNSLPMESRDRSSSGSTTSLPSNSNNGSTSSNELMRSIPMRIYLPEGAPVIQNIVPPSIDGQPTTLQSHFSTILPLLFPLYEPPLALPLIHGILIPLDTELQWLSGNLVGADGWLAIVLVLGR